MDLPSLPADDEVPPPPPSENEEEWSLAQKVAALVLRADALVFTTGAGMGVGGGLGTYRGRHAAPRWGPPHYSLALDEISSPAWFALPRLSSPSPSSSSSSPSDPATQYNSANFAIGYWATRYKDYSTARVHDGYHMLLLWSQGKLMDSSVCYPSPRFGCFSFTSNVDGHWARSGLSASRLLELHGSIEYLQCSPNSFSSSLSLTSPSLSSSSPSLASSFSPSFPSSLSLPRKTTECMTALWSAECLGKIEIKDYCALEPLPVCPFCKEVARPNMLLFNDFEYVNTRKVTQYNNYVQWQQEVAEGHGRVLIIEIGAGTMLASVRVQSEKLCQDLGATLVRINPEHPHIDDIVSGKGRWAEHIAVPTWDSVTFLRQVNAAIVLQLAANA